MGDQIAGLQHGLVLRRGARQQEKSVNRHLPLALRALHHDHRLQRRQRHIHVRRIGGDAVIAGAENGQMAVGALDRGATAARLALVARHIRIAEVSAAGALQQGAAGAGHIAQLRRRAREQRLGQHRVIALHNWMMGEVAVAHERTNLQPSIGQRLHLAQRQMVDVDHLLRAFDVEFH